MIDTKQMAYELYESSDVEFAEVFAYLNEMRKGALVAFAEPAEDNLERLTLTKEKMLAVTDETNNTLFNWLRCSLSEVIDSPEIDVSAWWKQEVQ